MTFKEYSGLDLVAVGEEVLQRWKKMHAFEKSLAVREGAPEFIFFEGPPSANGMPGIHHVMARSIKDAVCRYKTQAGIPTACRSNWASRKSSASPRKTSAARSPWPTTTAPAARR